VGFWIGINNGNNCRVNFVSFGDIVGFSGPRELSRTGTPARRAKLPVEISEGALSGLDRDAELNFVHPGADGFLIFFAGGEVVTFYGGFLEVH